MKKYIAPIILIGILFPLSFCKSVKNTAAAPTSAEAILIAAQKRWPDATMESIKAGETIYTTSCVRCHGDKGITNYTEEAWTPILDRMAPKAKLTAVEKENVKRFIFATLDTKKAK